MRSIGEFVKATVVGGVLVILPIALALGLVGKAVVMVLGVLRPVAHLLPATPWVAHLLALVIVVGTCFVVGLAVETRLGRLVNDFVQRRVLERLPAYGLLRTLSQRFGGVSGEDGDDSTFAPALAVIEDALVPAFIVEELPDGQLSVFVPAVPTPTVGALYILPPGRVHRLNVPLSTVVKSVTRWGVGAGELVTAMAPRPPAG